MKPSSVIKRLNQLSERYRREVAATKSKCSHEWKTHTDPSGDEPPHRTCVACGVGNTCESASYHRGAVMRNTKTQNESILKHMQDGRKIDAVTAWREYQCMRLAARIYNLRQAGHDIKSKSVPHEGGHHEVYWMEAA